jgi:hypothetical protein
MLFYPARLMMIRVITVTLRVPVAANWRISKLAVTKLLAHSRMRVRALRGHELCSFPWFAGRFDNGFV